MLVAILVVLILILLALAPWLGVMAAVVGVPLLVLCGIAIVAGLLFGIIKGFGGPRPAVAAGIDGKRKACSHCQMEIPATDHRCKHCGKPT